MKDKPCISNKNLCGRDGRTICGPQCVPKSTSMTLAVDEKTLPMATITGRTDRQSATQYAAPHNNSLYHILNK